MQFHFFHGKWNCITFRKCYISAPPPHVSVLSLLHCVCFEAYLIVMANYVLVYTQMKHWESGFSLSEKTLTRCKEANASEENLQIWVLCVCSWRALCISEALLEVFYERVGSIQLQTSAHIWLTTDNVVFDGSRSVK